MIDFGFHSLFFLHSTGCPVVPCGLGCVFRAGCRFLGFRFVLFPEIGFSGSQYGDPEVRAGVGG